MQEFYTWAILLINQNDEIGERQLSVLALEGVKIAPNARTPLKKNQWQFSYQRILT